MDETDIYEDVNARVPRQVAARVDLATFMMMFEHKLSHQQVLSAAEAQAVAAFLSLNIEEFAHLANFELPLKVCNHFTVTTSWIDPVSMLLYSCSKHCLAVRARCASATGAAVLCAHRTPL